MTKKPVIPRDLHPGTIVTGITAPGRCFQLRCAVITRAFKNRNSSFTQHLIFGGNSGRRKIDTLKKRSLFDMRQKRHMERKLVGCPRRKDAPDESTKAVK